MKNIELHIEKLVLHGFRWRDRFRIRLAVEQNLARLFTDQGIPSSLSRGGKFARIDGGKFNTAPGSGAEVIGARVAQSVYSGFKK